MDMTTAPVGETQALVGFRTNEEWKDILAQVAAMIEGLEKIEDAELRRNVFAALEAIDAVHREALHRLVRLFKEGVLNQVVTDPAIHTLMGMYDLLPAQQGGAGTAMDFLTAEERAAGPRSAPPPPGGLALPEPQPHWARVPLDQAMADGDAILFKTGESAVIIAKIENVLFAVDAVCPTHAALMAGGAVNGFSWLCPHGPGCVYDIRNGSRVGGGPGLAAHPVRPAEGGLQVGFGIPFAPKLPAF